MTRRTPAGRRVRSAPARAALVALVSLQPLTTGRASSDPLPAPGCAQVAQGPTEGATLYGPPTAEEIALLISVLDPVAVEGSARAPRLAVERTTLSKERLAALIDDATALLADLHARETLARLRRAPAVRAPARDRAAKTLEAVRTCARARYAGRGGEAAFAEAARVVEERRAALERLLLEPARAGR